MESTNQARDEPLTPDVRRRIVRICEQVAAEMPALVEAIVRTIRGEIPAYAVVPVREHRQWVREHVRILLGGIAEQRPPQDEHVRHARELGRLRARQGLAIELLLGAYHITYRETWNAILHQATVSDPELAGRLAYLVNLIWAWVRIMTGSASDAYSEELRRSHAMRINLRHRFLDALTAGDADTERAETLAHALGYRPDADFQALCMPAEHWPDDRIERLQGRLAALPGTTHCVARGSVVVVLGQHRDPEPVLAAIRQAEDQPAPAGVGLRRHGLAGASASIGDAEAALDWALPTGEIVHFGQDWLVVSLARQAGRLMPLFTDAVAVARADPHLAEAVLAFARGGLSIAGAARTLHLHPNSVAYRLDRWRERTGWDPRSGDGLVASLVALRLYPSSSV